MIHKIKSFVFAALLIMPLGSAYSVPNESAYVPIYSFGIPLRYQDQENNNFYQEIYPNFQSIYNLDDPAVQCQLKIADPDVTCILGSNDEGVDELFIIHPGFRPFTARKFKFFLPPGTLSLNMLGYIPQSTNIISVARLGAAPDVDIVPLNADGTAAFEFTQPRQALEDLKNGQQIYSTQHDGGFDLAFDSQLTEPLTEGQWLYVHILEHDIARQPRGQIDIFEVSLKVDRALYQSWFDTEAVFDNTGNPLVPANSGVDDPSYCPGADANSTLQVSVEVLEGDGVVEDSQAGHATFEISLNEAPTSTVCLRYATANGTARSAARTEAESATDGGDYVGLAETKLVFEAGGSQTSGPITVPIIADAHAEPREHFFINLYGLAGAKMAGDRSFATVNIVDDDPFPFLTDVAGNVVVEPSTGNPKNGLPAMSITDAVVDEGDPDDLLRGDVRDSTSLRFRVLLTHPYDTPITAQYRVLADTAQANVDFVPVEGTLNFESRETGLLIEVPVIPDGLDEGDVPELFFVQLFNGGVPFERSLGRGFILDDDAVDVSATDDTDADGVLDGADLCPNTAADTDVDANGCSQSQRDDDGDGVANDADACASTPANESVDASGCADSQRDTDGDGVVDSQDQCSATPADVTADSDTGCASGEVPDAQKDADGDGVIDDVDACPGTSADTTVDAVGCAVIPTDTDQDGVADDLDQCANTPADEGVNADGCSASQLAPAVAVDLNTPANADPTVSETLLDVIDTTLKGIFGDTLNTSIGDQSDELIIDINGQRFVTKIISWVNGQRSLTDQGVTLDASGRFSIVSSEHTFLSVPTVLEVAGFKTLLEENLPVLANDGVAVTDDGVLLRFAPSGNGSTSDAMSVVPEYDYLELDASDEASRLGIEVKFPDDASPWRPWEAAVTYQGATEAFAGIYRQGFVAKPYAWTSTVQASLKAYFVQQQVLTETDDAPVFDGAGKVTLTADGAEGGDFTYLVDPWLAPDENSASICGDGSQAVVFSLPDDASLADAATIDIHHCGADKWVQRLTRVQ